VTNPRYDEQFRRGYAGPPVPPPAQASVSTPEPIAPERPNHDSHATPVPVGGEQVAGEDSRAETADADRPLEVGTTRPFRRNPFAIGLLAVGVLMLIVGVWLIEQSTAPTATFDQQAVSQVESQLTAPLLTGGVVAIVAWLVLGAFAASTGRRSD